MSTDEPSDDADIVYCNECGAEIKRSAEICNECGVRQTHASQSAPGQPPDSPPSPDEPQAQQSASDSTGLLEAYSVLQWLIAVVVAIVSFPIGLIVPGYLFYKAQNGTGKEQSGLEAWTAILFGIIGIIAVEIGGRTAAKVLWALTVVLVALGLFAVLGM